MNKREVQALVEAADEHKRRNSPPNRVLGYNIENYTNVLHEMLNYKVSKKIPSKYGMTRGQVAGIVRRIREDEILSKLVPKADPSKQHNSGRKMERGPELVTRRKPRAGTGLIVGEDIFVPKTESQIPIPEQYTLWLENKTRNRSEEV